MQEYIGKVCMDYTWYPGEDLYSDGVIEDRLLEIAENYKEEEFNQVIDREKDWAILYHLSHVRQNIVDWLPLKKTDKVLEIGAGCGAITGVLAEKAGQVTCVDLSKKRSLVNANRHRKMDNIRIIVGNFQDIEPNLTEQYDYVTLIGVFEYAKGYIGTDAPYTEFLRQVTSHLKPGGRLVMAIENRLGLKYWAGCREDHTGRLFEGLENYQNPQTGVRTFSRPELEQLFDQVGLKNRRFYYPYPDYKLPMTVYSDEYLPKKGELNTNIWNFDRERIVLFDEEKVYDSLLESGVFPLFSNSYLVLAEKTAAEEKAAENVQEDTADAGFCPQQVLYSKFSNERSCGFAIRTDIVKEENGELTVHKTADSPQAKAFIDQLKEHAESLKQMFSGIGILVNELRESAGGEAVFSYISEAVTLEQKLYEMWHGGQKEAAVRALTEYTAEIRSLAAEPFIKTEAFTEVFGDVEVPQDAKSMKVTDLDLVTENILLTGDERHLIDFEWTFDFPIPVNFVIYRIWHYFFQRNVSKQPAEIEALLYRTGYNTEELQLYTQMEQAFQKYVTGTHVPVREMYRFITPGCIPLELAETGGIRKMACCYNSTLFYGSEPEFSQERSISAVMQAAEDGSFEVSFHLKEMETPNYLRWDPLEGKICSILVEEVSAEKPLKIAAVNASKEAGRDVFYTKDPIYHLEGDFEGIHKLTIRGKLEIMSAADAVDGMCERVEAAERLLGEIRGTKGFRALEKARRARNRINHTLKTVGKKSEMHQKEYQLWAEMHRADAKTLEQQRMSRLSYEPKISILVPVYRTPMQYLTEMIDSVRNQSYRNWELCIADASLNDDLTECLREYAAQDVRIRFVSLPENGGISENTNAAAELATGEFIGLLDHDDLLSLEALYEVALVLQDRKTDVVYTDEDKVSMNSDRYFDPHLKPDFSPDLLRSHNYITHFFVVKKTLFEQVGRFRKEFDGAQDYDLILRCTELAQKICHVPKILYHWRTHANSTAENPESKLYAYEAGKHAIEEHLKRCGRKGEVEIMPLWGMNHVKYETTGDPLVSVIIPNMDHTQDLNRCVRSILEKNTYPNIEILIVENNSQKKKTFEYYRKLHQKFPQIRILRWQKEFNYSAINNYGVSKAKGEYVLLLNNDTELIEPDSIREMLGLCMQKETGCVGAKLLFADNTVQHAGIVLGFGGFAGHVFSKIKKDAIGYMMRARIIGNFSAVTAACLMVRKEVYEQVGGLDESFAVALNDVDFCLRVQKTGYLNVLQPFSIWHHYESKSRGYEDTPEKSERFAKEVARFRERWGKTVDAGDPYYNPNFSVEKEPFNLK